MAATVYEREIYIRAAYSHKFTQVCHGRNLTSTSDLITFTIFVA